jgi:hypothetical protein
LLAAHPNDPGYLYLAALAETGRNTAQAVMRLQPATERSFRFGLPHLLLAQIYSARAHEDTVKVKAELEAFATACPESIRAFGDQYSRHLPKLRS